MSQVTAGELGFIWVKVILFLIALVAKKLRFLSSFDGGLVDLLVASRKSCLLLSCEGESWVFLVSLQGNRGLI